MADILSFKNKRPRLRIEMDDDTIINVAVPTVEMVEEMKASLPMLTAALNAKGAESRRALYSLAAKLINNNLDAERVTVDDLVHKYEWAVEELVQFYLAYKGFIESIEHEKN